MSNVKYGNNETLSWKRSLRTRDLTLRPKSAVCSVRSGVEVNKRPQWAPRPWSATTLITPPSDGPIEPHMCSVSRRALSLGSALQKRLAGDTESRKRAARGLRDMRRAAEPVAHALAEALCFDGSAEVHTAASSALCAMGSAGAAASAYMLQADLSTEQQDRIAHVLGEVGDEAGPWAFGLGYVLDGEKQWLDKQCESYKAAASAMGKLGPAGIDGLVRTVGKPANLVAQRRAAEVLGDLPPSTQLTEVARALAEDDPNQRRAAAVVLGEMFCRTSEKRYSLEFPQEDDWDVQWKAARALGALEGGELIARRRRHVGLWGHQAFQHKRRYQAGLGDSERTHPVDLSTFSTWKT